MDFQIIYLPVIPTNNLYSIKKSNIFDNNLMLNEIQNNIIYLIYIIQNLIENKPIIEFQNKDESH